MAPKIASIAAGMLNVRYSEYIDKRDKRSEVIKNKTPIINVLLLENSPAILLITDIYSFTP